MANYNTKLSNILCYWQLSMAPFHFCETFFTTHQTVRGQQECDYSILGRGVSCWLRPGCFANLVRSILIMLFNNMWKHQKGQWHLHPLIFFWYTSGWIVVLGKTQYCHGSCPWLQWSLDNWSHGRPWQECVVPVPRPGEREELLRRQ